jgi:hypothetical protein
MINYSEAAAVREIVLQPSMPAVVVGEFLRLGAAPRLTSATTTDGTEASFLGSTQAQAQGTQGATIQTYPRRLVNLMNIKYQTAAAKMCAANRSSEGAAKSLPCCYSQKNDNGGGSIILLSL